MYLLTQRLLAMSIHNFEICRGIHWCHTVKLLFIIDVISRGDFSMASYTKLMQETCNSAENHNLDSLWGPGSCLLVTRRQLVSHESCLYKLSDSFWARGSFNMSCLWGTRQQLVSHWSCLYELRDSLSAVRNVSVCDGFSDSLWAKKAVVVC